MPETALNRLRQVEPSEGDRFVEHCSTPLLRSGPLAGEILRLRDSGKLLLVFAPSVRAASCAHLSRTPEQDRRSSQVLGWKNVHKQNDDLIGKKQDKLGRWRTAKGTFTAWA
jgi:hypothetical protein